MLTELPALLLWINHIAHIRFFVHKVVEVLFWLQISAQSNYKSNAAEQVAKRLFLDLIFLVLLNLNKHCRLRLCIMQIDI